MRTLKSLIPYLLCASGCVVAPSQHPAASRRPSPSRTPNTERRPATNARRPQPSTPARRETSRLDGDEITRMKQRAARDPQDAQLNYILAVLYAKANNAAASTEQLERLTRKHWTLGIDLHDFRNIASDPKFRSIAAQLRSRQTSVRTGTMTAKINAQGHFPEGIAWDPTRKRFYIGNTQDRDITAVDGRGQMRPLRVSGPQRMFAPLGMRVDDNGKILWVATVAMKMMQGYTPELAGRSALVAIDLETSKIIGRFESGNRQSPSLFNDVQPLGDGRRAIVSDSLRGTLFIASLGKNAMGQMLPAGSFEGPNGLAYDPVGERIFVADSLGISVVNAESSRATRVRGPAGEYFGGVDGLCWWKGNLVGIQNAVGALRIWSAPVSGDELGKPKVLSSADPRLGAVTTGATNSQGLWFIGDAQFRQYGPNGKLKSKAQLPALELFNIPL